jgi:hypothetical protein
VRVERGYLTVARVLGSPQTLSCGTRISIDYH